MKNVIIDHPEWQTPKQKVGMGLLAFGFWLLWFYLWVPFVTLAIWVAGVYAIGHHSSALFGRLVSLLGNFPITPILLLVGSLIGWAVYNIVRFRGLNRRVPKPGLALEHQARHFDVAPDDLRRWHHSQMLVVEIRAKADQAFLRSVGLEERRLYILPQQT